MTTLKSPSPPPSPAPAAASEPKSGARPSKPDFLAAQTHRRPFLARHGKLLCAITAGLLLLAATIYHWTSAQEVEHEYAYLVPVGIAFAIGFCFGSAEAWLALRQGKLDIHFLMVLGAVLAIPVGAMMEGATLLFLFTLSGALEDYAMQRTKAALESLMKLFPKEAIVLQPDGSQRTVPLVQLKIGDRILIKPGENVAADGAVLEGTSAIDESAITGEFMPREKAPGSAVFAGTLNTAGRLIVEVLKPAHDTTLAQIIHLVSQAQEEKAPVERLFDRVGTAYTILVLLGSVAGCLAMHHFFAVPWLSTHDPVTRAVVTSGAIYRAITLLIVASPCALIISTPVVILSAIATCARRGIVLKGGRHLESIAALKSLVFDKTGTLTTGQVRLVDIEMIDPLQAFAMPHYKEHDLQRCATEPPVLRPLPEPGALDEVLLRAAASLEANSTHPLAAAVVRAAHDRGLELFPIQDFQQESGHGLRGMIHGQLLIIGAPKILHGLCNTKLMELTLERIAEGHRLGQTAVVMFYGGRAALLKFQDTLRPDAKATIDRLHALGLKPLVMLTGDNRAVAEAVGGPTGLGLDEIRAELLPKDKLTQVADLVAKHTVVGMVGDGINDAPALARATVGIAMGTIGSEAAMQAADVVLLSDRIERLPWLIETARRARRVMVQNLAFSIAVIMALVTFTSLGEVNMTLGVIGHEGSTVLVVFNGLRLLLAGREGK
jgi:Zn2+/Cd2+-exporting ATPase